MKKLLYILTIAIHLTTWAQTEKTDPTAFDKTYFDAMKYRLKEDYAKSNELFEQCLVMQADNDVILFKMAQNYFDAKNLHKAEFYVNKAIELNPKNRWYHKLFVEIQIKKGISQKKANKLINAFSKIAHNKYLVYDLYRKQYAKSKSIAVTYQTPKTNKQNNDFKTLFLQQKYVDLSKKTEQRINDQPDDAKAYYWKAKALSALKKYKKSLEYLDMGMDFVLRDKEWRKKYYQLYMELYQNLGKTKKAEKYKQKLQKIWKDYYTYYSFYPLA